jgi:hypothetical protein
MSLRRHSGLLFVRQHADVASHSSVTDWLTDWLIKRSKVLLGELTLPQQANKFPALYITLSSLQHSQQPSTCPVLNQRNPDHAHQIYFFNIRFNIIPLPSGQFPSSFQPNINTEPTEALVLLFYTINHSHCRSVRHVSIRSWDHHQGLLVTV